MKLAVGIESGRQKQSGEPVTGIPSRQILARHQFGDWGDLCEEDEPAHRDSVKYGEHILSAYKLEKEVGGSG